MKHGGDIFGRKKVREPVRVIIVSRRLEIVFIFPKQVL